MTVSGSVIVAASIICIACVGICLGCVALIKDDEKMVEFWHDYWQYWKDRK